MRIALKIAYNGAHFMGFQEQPGGGTVTDTLMGALRHLGITDKPVGAGRTDRGVHATGQIVALNLPPFWRGREQPFADALGRMIAPWITIRALWRTSEAFHPRYDALIRRYRYILRIGRPSPFDAQTVTQIAPCDIEAVAQAATLFKGRHDFTWFKKNSEELPHYNRTIYRVGLYARGGHHILFFDGDAFLRSQIRMMTAFLIAVGQGRATPADLAAQLALKYRTLTELAPAEGLYLSGISYAPGLLQERLV